jgi:integration host factor subunit beta
LTSGGFDRYNLAVLTPSDRPVTLRNAMTKADLINIVAKQLDITQVQSGIIVEAALKSIVSALQGGQEVEIRGFGSFRFRNRAPRKGRNPKTGEKVDVPPKRIPYFKMGKELKALLNGSLQVEEGADRGSAANSASPASDGPLPEA